MSGPEKGVDADPDYAVVCGFLRRYGEALGLPPMSFGELQKALEDTTRLNPDLILMQIKLMRKIGKSVHSEKWERYLVKMCRQFSQMAAWEMEQGGYQGVDPNIKLKLLKYLCERQFDDNLKFRADVVNKEEADSMREKPLGRDKNGMLYWYMQDVDTNLHLYREEQDDQYNSTWQVVCRTRDELEGLIAELEGGGKTPPEQEEDDDKSSSTDQPSLADEDKENKEAIQTNTDTKPSKEEAEKPKPITSQPVSVIVKREVTPEPVKVEESVVKSSVKQEDNSLTQDKDEVTTEEKVTAKTESVADSSAKSTPSSTQQVSNESKGETSKGADNQQGPPLPKPVSHVHKGSHSIENILRDVPIKCERDAITEPPHVVSASMDHGLQTFANGRIHYCMGEGGSVETVQMQGDRSSQDGGKERRSPGEDDRTVKHDDNGAGSKETSETAAVEEAKLKVREILSKNTLNNANSNTESAGGRTENDKEGQRSAGSDTGNKMTDSGKEIKTTDSEVVPTKGDINDSQDMKDSQGSSDKDKTEESRSTKEPEMTKVIVQQSQEGGKTKNSKENTTSESDNSGKERKEPEKESKTADDDVSKSGKRSAKTGKDSKKSKGPEDPGKETDSSRTNKDNTGKESKAADDDVSKAGKRSAKTGRESEKSKEAEDPGKETDSSCTNKDNPGKENNESDMATENTGGESDHPGKEKEESQKEETTKTDSLETSKGTTKPQRGRKRGRRGRKSLKEVAAVKKTVKEKDEDLEEKEQDMEEGDDSRSVSKDSESSKEAPSTPVRRSTRARKAVQQVYTPEVKKKAVAYVKEPSEPSLPPSPKPVKKTRGRRGRPRRGRRRKDSSSEEESSEEEEESSEEDDSDYVAEDDSPCCKCGQYNHPEWILLCDKCDSGYHTACLRPPLMVIPDGDWFCPSCEHVELVVKLRQALSELDQELKKKHRAERRKERLTYVGISLENVIPEPEPESELVSGIDEQLSRPRHQHKKKKKHHHHHHRHHEYEKPVKTIAERRTSRRTRKEISYRFDDFDEVINEAIQEDIKASEGAGGCGGKDIENIIAAEGGVVKKEGRKKGRRRLMDLDADSEEEVGSEEEYNMSEGSEQSEVEEEPSENSPSLSESEDSLAQRTRRRFHPRSARGTRRSSRLRSGRKRRYWDSDEEEEDDIEEEHSSGSSDNIPRWSGVRTYSARRQKVCYKESSSSDEEQEKTKRSELPDLEWEPEEVKEEWAPKKRPRVDSSSDSESSSDETRDEPRKPARRQLDTSESDEEEQQQKDDQKTEEQEEDSNKKELRETLEDKEDKDDASIEGNKMGVSFQLPKVSKSLENSPTDTLPLPAQMTQNGTHDSSGRSSRQSGEDEDELLANVMDLVAYVTEDD